MRKKTQNTSVFEPKTLAWRIEWVAGLLLLLLFPCGPALAQEEDGEAIPYSQLKAQANLESKAVGALEAVAQSSGSLENGKFNISISVRFEATQNQLNTWKAMFNKASKLLYDATDGQLQFGEILICNNSRGGKNADIWIHPPSGRSHVPGGCVPGLGKEDCHINLYAEDITDSNANADGAHTITHEWGHYALGMFDEYVTDPPKSGAICQIPRTYQAPDPPPNSEGSLMENYWLRDITEFCVSSNHDLDNPTTAGDEGGDTWQEDVHGESTWETLVDNFPSVNLPNGLPDQAMPTGHMDITWKVLEPETRLSLIIDESGSMSGSNIQNARSGAKLFVDLTKEGDKLGVGSFDSNARTVFSMTEVTASSKSSAKTAIDGISAGGSTNIGGGLEEGLNQIVNAGDPACQQTIILLSDGEHNTGTNPLNVIPDLSEKNITVNAIALGSAANTPPLRRVAEDTGGKLFFANSPSDLASIFAKLQTQTTDNGGLITAPRATVDPGQLVTEGVDVESGVQEATFLISWSGSADINLTLESPSGATITPSSASDPNIGHTEESTSEFYTVQDPDAGEWTMRIEGAGSNTSSTEVSAQASGVNPKISFRASPNEVDVDFPDPVRIEANAQAPVTVTGVTVAGTATRPDGSTVPVTVVDDGTGSDVLADDGIYTASFDDYNGEGAYNFEITATTGSLNSGEESKTARLFRGEALFTDEARNGNIGAVPPSGPSDTPAPVFTRSESFSVNVEGVDTTPPEIRLEGANPLEVECDDDGTYSDPGATATDAVDPDPTLTQIENTVDVGTPGEYKVTYEAVDDGGNKSTKTRTVKVVDTTPPALEVTAAPTELWPPNHKYHTVSLGDLIDDGTLTASDACDETVGPGDVTIASVTSDEPENGPGDGNTVNDIVIGEDCQSVQLRAERQGIGNGRVYTINLEVTDAEGNTSEATHEVHVPRSRKGTAIKDSGSGYQVDCSDSKLTSKGLNQPEDQPEDYALEAPQPNPVTNSTVIGFSLPEDAPVTLTIYDALGRKVERLVNQTLPAGQYTIRFDAARLPSGTYLYRFRAGPYTKTRHMVVVK